MRSVRRKIIHAFGVVIISSLIVESAIIVANEAVFRRYRTVTDNLLQEYQLVERADSFVTDYFSYTKTIGDEGRRATYLSERQAYLDILEYLDGRVIGSDNRVALMAVHNTVNSMLAEAQTAVEEAERGDLSRMSARYGEVSRLAAFVGETGTSLVIKDLATSAKLDAETSSLRQILGWLVFGMMLAISLGSIAFALSFARRFVAPLLELVNFADKVGAGDLTAELPRSATAGGDESSTLATAFSKTVDTLRGRLRDIEKANARTKSIVEGAPFGAHTFRLEADGRLIFVATNRSAEKIIGPEHAKLVGMTLEEAFPGNVGTEIPDAYRRVAATGVPYEKAQYTYTGGGISGVFEVSAVQTALQEVTAFFRDITERVKAEMSLRQSESDLNVAQTVAHIGSWRLNQETGAMTWSEEAGRIFGMDPKQEEINVDEIIGLRVHPDDRAKTQSFLGAAKTGTAVEPIEIRVVRADGSMRSVRIETSNRVMGAKGELMRVTGICQDVTERQLAEKALEESESRYRAIVENTSDVIFATDASGRVTYVSPKIAHYGMNVADVVGRSMIDLIAEEDRERVMGAFEHSLAEPEDLTPVSLRLRNKKGETFWVEETDSVQIDAEGKPTGIIGILRDVTERRAAEDSARSATEMENFFTRRSAALVGVSSNELGDKITDILKDLGTRFEVDRSSIFVISDDRKTMTRRYAWFKAGGYPDDPGKMMKAGDFPWIFSVLSGNDIISFNGLRTMPEDGVKEMNKFNLSEDSSVVFVPLKVEGKTFGGFVLTDLSGRHHWQEGDYLSLRLVSELFGSALGRQLSERRFREADLIIGSGSIVALTWHNVEGWPIEYASRNVLALTGYEDAVFLSGERSYQSLIHPEDAGRVDAEIKRYAAQKLITEFQHEPYRLVAEDGSVKWLSVRMFIERDADGNPMYYRGLIEDITARRAAELKVAELNRLRQRFIHVVSHQLRTPLNSIRWSLEAMLSGELGEMKKEQRDFVRVVYDAEIEIISRIHDMITALDIEEGRVSISKEAVTAQSIFGSVLSELQPLAQRRHVTIESDVEGGEFVSFQADPGKLHFAIRAIMHNAVVYSREGGKVRVTASVADGRFRLTVADDGIGIPAVEQSSIFNRFFRASNASVVNQNASGLGLSIAKYYVEKHGGTMGFESVEDKGSKFFLEVPLA